VATSENAERVKDAGNFVGSGLLNVVVPEVYTFLELVAWCIEIYVSRGRVIILVDLRKPVVYLTLAAFRQMLNFHDVENSYPLGDDDFPVQYEKLPIENTNKLILRYMDFNTKFPKGLRPYPNSIFSRDLRKGISMMCQILDYENYQMVDHTILGFMALITPPIEEQFVIFDYYTFLSYVIDAQLRHFTNIKTLRYQVYVVHCILK